MNVIKNEVSYTKYEFSDILATTAAAFTEIATLVFERRDLSTSKVDEDLLQTRLTHRIVFNEQRLPVALHCRKHLQVISTFKNGKDDEKAGNVGIEEREWGKEMQGVGKQNVGNMERM